MLKKPGKPKSKNIKMPKPPQEKHCRGCDCVTTTERWCHAESRLIKMEDGGGIMGSRINHKYTAWLCIYCDSGMSLPLPKNATQKELKHHEKEWNRLIKLSH